MFALAALVAPAVGAGGPLPEVGDGWIEATSPHFVVFSQAGRRKTARITNDLEQLRSALVRLSADEPVEGVPTLVYLFENDRAFEPFKYREDGEPATVSGFFRSNREANFMALDSTAGYDSGVVFHEYVHCWVSNTAMRMPLWVEEGLAELYQTFTVRGDSIQFGKPIARHLGWFRDNPVIPLEELFAVDHDDPLYTDEAKKPGFYAQSWALVHLMVLGNPERRPQLQRYLGLVAQGAGRESAFDGVFEGETEVLEGELDRYVRRRIFKIFDLDLELGSAPEVVIRPLAEAEALARLGELLLSESPPRSEAGRYFEAALASDGHCGAAYDGLARIAERERNWKEADAMYASAIAAAPDDPMVLFHRGDALLAGRGDLEFAARLLRRSVELAPGFGPAWSSLAAALLEAGAESETVLAAARIAYQLLPHDRDASWDLLTALAGAGQWDEARAFVGSAFSEMPADRGRALRLLVHKALEETLELASSAKCDQAETRVEWAADLLVGADDGITLRLRVDEARSAVAECRLAGRLAAAEVLLEQGQVEQARLMLVEIAGRNPGNEISMRALRLVDRIDNPDREAGGMVISAISVEDLDRLNANLAAGDFEQALKCLAEFRARSGPSEKTWIDAKINEVRRALDHNRYVEQFNRAVDLFNAEEYTAVIRVLERLIERMPAGFDTTSARSLLAKARAAGTP